MLPWRSSVPSEVPHSSYSNCLHAKSALLVAFWQAFIVLIFILASAYDTFFFLHMQVASELSYTAK